MDIALALGRKVKQLRQTLDLTQKEFAEKMDINQRYLSVWENGKFVISTNNLIKLHLVFHVSLSFFDIEKKECPLCKRSL